MRLAFALGLMTTALLTQPTQGAPEFRSAAALGLEDLPQIQILAEDNNGLILEVSLPTLAMEEISEGGRRFQSIEIPGGGVKGEVGQPAIPTFGRFVAIPDEAGVVVTATLEGITEIPDVLLAPVQGDEGAEFAYDREAYARSGFGSAAPATVGSPAILRDLRVVPLTVRPIDYDPATQTLRVAEKVRIDVRFEGRNLENARQSNRTSIPPSFERIYEQLVVNYDGPPAGMMVQPGTYLLICPNDSNVTSRLQPLIDWRERKGATVILATTAQTGTSTGDIKNYIQGIYDTADPPLEYVALVGDATTPYRIRTWFETLSGYGGEGDHPYTELDGGDYLADVHIGRLSFNTTTELETIVAKTVGYESTPYIDSDPGWFTRACLTGDPYDSGYSCVMVQQWIKRRIREIGYTQIDTIYTTPFVTDMRNSLNQGTSIFSYRGFYNMSGWTNSNTYALSNGWKMPFVVTITCDTGSFAYGTARSEGFLRAGSASTPKGGIGSIATATIGTHTRYNNCLHLGIYYGLIYEGSYNLGAALTRGELELWLNYGETQQNNARIWAHWGNLMGDPAVECWTGYPEPLTVDYPSSIPIGATSVVVTVEEGGQPSADAQVCLVKDGETHSVGFTDEQGIVEVPIQALNSGQMLVTVTKHNRHPHLGSIPVAGEQRYVSYLGSLIDDDNGGQSTGNGDGLINPGETIELNIQLKNYGLQSATDVHAFLTEDDPYVTLLTNSRDYGSIASGGTAWSQGAYTFSLEPDCPHGHAIQLGLEIDSESDQWHSLIELPVVAADLAATGEITVYDVGSWLDPGESGQVSIEISNNGGATADSPSASLLSMSEFVSITDGTGSYGSIPVGGTAENTSDRFGVEVSPDCYDGYQANMKLILSFSGGVSDTAFVTIPIAIRNSDDPTGPCAYGYYAFDNTDTSYPEHPTYNWIEINPGFGGSGTQIELGDYGDYQDKSRTVDIPFTFRYYGEDYDRATICSNGWLSMGATWTAEYRNWTIPGAGGPEAMIAGFWDDLQETGSGHVYQWFDAANHRWIVEWSGMRNDYGSSYYETFEIILYDPAYHPTETGDGIIEMQYDTVANVDPTDGYATVGIENQDQSVGVLYTYFNRYADGAAGLTSGRAIRFVPTREVLVGTIYGTVRNEQADGIPVPEATITVAETGDEYLTGFDGTYVASQPPGTYTLFATHEGFEPDTVSSVDVVAGGAIEVNFDLRDIAPPEIVTTPVASTADTVGPYVVNVTIIDPTPLDVGSLFYRINGGSFIEIPLTSMFDDDYRADIPGQSLYTKVEYYIYAQDRAGNDAFDPPAAPSELFVFYVAPTVHLLFDDGEAEHGWSVGSLEDTATNGTWELADPNGTYDGVEEVQPEDDHTADPGVRCWVTENAPPGSGSGMGDVDNGRTTLVSPRMFLNLEGEVLLRYYRWFSNDTGLNPGEDPWVVQITDDDGANWVDLENTIESDRSWRLMEFNLADYIEFTDQVRIRFIATDDGGASVVEAAVDDIEILFTGLYENPASAEDGILSRFGLAQNRPNPFNPRTAISFSLEAPGTAQLAVYDVRGRLIRRLVDGAQPAGVHSVVWDGRDESGRSVPSGIYLYRLDAGTQSVTKKMMLLE